MATVNFSVPEDVKRTFNRAFAGANKSAVVAQLMRQAVEERRRQHRRRRAIERLLRLRRTMKPVAEVATRAARAQGRP
jgi:metal-responsive CopG/Arc/MetJ family transcriptional regulator